MRLRALEHLAYRYWTKDKNRSGKDNWLLAEMFLRKLEKRYKIKNDS